MENANPVPIPLRAKYRKRATVKQNKAQSRTGPNCCNGNCARRHRKGWSKVAGRGLK